MSKIAKSLKEDYAVIPGPESGVIAAVFEYLVWYGAIVIRVNSGAIKPEDQNGKTRWVAFYRWQVLGDDEHIDGISDIVALLPDGKLLICECKAPGKKGNVSEAQARFMAAARMRGAVVCVATCVEDVMQALLGVTE